MIEFSQEWLETNGIGGFACGTVANCNSRRYHALLCAATRPPLGRVVLVNKADETLSVGERHFDLGSNCFPGALHPNGVMYLESFEIDPFPCWTYRVPGARLRKSLWMPHGQNCTVVRYDLLEGSALLSLRPYVSGRDYHGTHRFNEGFSAEYSHWHENSSSHFVQMHPYPELPPVVWSHDGDFFPGGAWYYSFELAVEKERGLEYTEDWWCPGAWVWRLTPENPTAWHVTGIEPHDLHEARATQEQERHRRAALTAPPLCATGAATSGAATSDAATSDAATSDAPNPPGRAPDPVRDRLVRACDAFVVRREDGLNTVLAGYPWFSDWGRDTMIALPGLCLSTGRYADARSILTAFARAMSEGMIPNRFPDAGETPDTNTIDATLWFFHAIARYVDVTGDEEALRSWYPALQNSLQCHLEGTRFGIQGDESDGLLRGGSPETQLTWMDVKVGDWVVTPRDGKPVEIQALWYGALCSMRDFARRLGDEPTRALCDSWAGRARESFPRLFWNEASNCLFDCISLDGTPDGSIRPNQIFAVSLPHKLLSSEQQRAVVSTVERDLLTPRGLRSLSPRDARYRGVYIGDQWLRDGAYHQGTVWGWLMGPFISAYLHVNEHTGEARRQCRLWLAPLIEHLDEACINSVSEVFDGDAPHAPRGCFAQAWSVAELLRAWDESE